ncbi:MAG: hypothetical protein AAF367_16075 [Pseudomonadota bacterium]
MADRDDRFEIDFLRAFLRPAYVVMMVLQMVLGLALFVTLIVKYYMLVFGTEVCSADSASLGNLMRCTNTLEIAGHFLLALAGIRFAAFMFQDRPRALLGPLVIGLSGTLLLFIAGLRIEHATWSVAAIIVTLMLSISAVIGGQFILTRLRSRD